MRSTGSRLGQLFRWVFILVIMIIIAIAITPLNLYYPHVEAQLRPIKLSGISGSAVKGSAENLTYITMPLGEAEWLLYPRSYNALAGEVRVNKQHYDLKFDINRIEKGLVEVGKIRGFLDWELIRPYVQMNYGQLAGYAQFNLQGLKYAETGGLEQLYGDITLQDFKMLQPSAKDMGTVKLVFETKTKGMIVGTFSSDSQVLSVSGTLFLQPNRWQLNLNIIPKGGHFELDAILSSVGDARRGGGRQLNLAGFY
ncbi:MAG: type II secretion system protein N [Xanthomonadales bacterium]|nr:type II secretion system protein N [Xanthomonadales bacterium]